MKPFADDVAHDQPPVGWIPKQYSVELCERDAAVLLGVGIGLMLAIGCEWRASPDVLVFFSG